VLIEQKENVGYINNFLCGIEKATKDIIFLSDQDDIWLPQKIQIYTELFNTHLDMLALHGNTSLIDTSNHIIKENFQQYEKKLGKICLKDYLKKVNYPGMSLAFRNGDFKKKMLNTTEVIDRLPT